MRKRVAFQGMPPDRPSVWKWASPKAACAFFDPNDLNKTVNGLQLNQKLPRGFSTVCATVLVRQITVWSEDAFMQRDGVHIIDEHGGVHVASNHLNVHCSRHARLTRMVPRTCPSEICTRRCRQPSQCC